MSRLALEWRGIVKAFPGVVALDGVDCAVTPGEVVALLGENGAGKTTLLSIAAGLYRPDAGTILINETPATLRSPRDALALGVGMVHQHFRLVDAFTVTENVLLGRRRPRFLLSTRVHDAEVARLARAHGLDIEPDARVGTLSVGERQRVEILKLLYGDARVLLLDEPTAVLTPQEVDRLTTSIRRMASEGRAVVFSTHKLSEAIDLADRIVILRKGRMTGAVLPDETNVRELAHMMVGHEWEAHRPTTQRSPGPVVLEAVNVRATGESGLRIQDVTLGVRAGEIVGLAGVAGNGQRELAEVIAGLRMPEEGCIRLDDRDVTHLGPRERWALGLRYIPEDRLQEGLVPSFSVAENSVLRDFHRAPIRRGLQVDWQAARMRASELVHRFGVRTPSLDVSVASLSGGNQQRVLVGREVQGSPRVLVALYPTRGLDVAASLEVHRTLSELCSLGCGVVLVSESLDELFFVAHRIVVLHRGRLVGGAPTTELTREQVGLWMAGAA
ncbi:MAG: ABC transporter ATP-binding protein [Armatimonadota bacterium]|nr:ABC transporter ATP-binding protein [Armatimonadota bacterium]